MKLKLKRLACRAIGHRKPRLFRGAMNGKLVTFTACPRCRVVLNIQAGTRSQRRQAWRKAWKTRTGR